jgi:putative addiction module component (TIGR02574 family)
MTPDELEQLKNLSVEERIRLVAALWDSIADRPESLPVTDAQRFELDRRLAAHRKDPGAARRWAPIRDELKRRK